MSDPWKDAWEHLKKQIDSDIETCETWESLYADYKGRTDEGRQGSKTHSRVDAN